MINQTLVTTIKLERDQRQTITIPGPGKYLVILAGEGAEAMICGRFKTQGQEKLDVQLVIHHQAGHTLANTSLRAVAADQSQVTIKGKILIDQNCPQANSFLTERVLLLSDQAKAETVPDLEILSDDVKCSHAASISQIPEEQLFYLMSRGISRKKAEKLVVEGFLS